MILWDSEVGASGAILSLSVCTVVLAASVCFGEEGRSESKAPAVKRWREGQWTVCVCVRE
jgi:hypothetical protein